jgi:hypothetical protein
MKRVRVALLLTFVLAVAARLDAATATWDRNPESNVSGYLLSYGTQSGVHPTVIDVGNATTYQFFPPPGQRYYVVVQAYNTSGGIGPKSAEVTVDVAGPVNQPPTITQPANQSTAQNASASLAIVASDPNGTALSFSASGLPPGMGINAASGVIAGTPTAAGSYSVTVVASDGSLSASRTFTWTVTAGTGSTTIALSPADTTLHINNTYLGGDHRLAVYTWPANRVTSAILMKFDLSQIPANATVQSAVLSLALIETDGFTSEQNYNVSLHQIVNKQPNLDIATGWIANGTTLWTPNTCCNNNVPLAQSDISAARAVTAVSRTLGTKTWDATSLVQAWRATPTQNYGLLLNADTAKGEHRFRYFASVEHPTAAQRPVLRVTYTTGGGGVTDTTAPTVSLTSPANGATVSGANVSIAATAADAVGVTGVQFRLDGANLGSQDTVAPYAATWNTTTATNGSHVLTAVARDAAGNTRTSASITVTVNNVAANRAPVLTQPANQTGTEGAADSLALSASDPDGNPLTFSATGLPGGLAINTASGLISGTLSFTSAGVHSVTAMVSDGSLSHSRTFTWTVANTNGAPVLTQPANQTSTTSTSVSLQLSGSDPDGTAVTYSATGLPPGLAINATSGLIAGALASNSAGSYSVTARVSDGALSASRTFSWTVTGADQSGADIPLSADFDGDGRSDAATYRPSNGEWRVWLSGSNFAAATPGIWGAANDRPVPADYDGDRRADLAVYRPSTGTWYILLSSTAFQTRLDLRWGNSTDRPIPIDYDGDGKADLGLARAGGFEILLSRSNYTTSVTVQ